MILKERDALGWASGELAREASLERRGCDGAGHTWPHTSHRHEEWQGKNALLHVLQTKSFIQHAFGDVSLNFYYV